MPFPFLHTARRAWVALVLLFLVSLPAVTTRIYASDEVEYLSYLRSLWFDRDVSFENEYRYFDEHGLSRASGFRETFLERRTVTGRRENWGTIGSAILWSPFYAAGDLTARALRLAGRPVEVDGYSPPYIAAVCYGSAFYGFMAVVLSALAARRVLGAGAAGPGEEAAVLLAVWIGTPLVFYMYVSPPFSHACSAFAVSAFVLAWLRVRERWSARGFVLLGVLGALMTMVREQDAFVAVGPALDCLWAAFRPASRPAGSAPSLASLLGGAALGAGAFAVAFLPQAFAYLALNGRIGPSRVVARKMYWSAPHALQVIVSPEHGLFFWTPIAVLSLAGLGALLVRSGDRRRLAVAFVAMFALQVYVSGCVESWSAAGAFGHRRFVGSTVIFVVGLAALVRLTRWRPARVGLAAVAAVCVWWNVALMVQFGTGLMNRQQLELGRNARLAFIEVPARLPELAWRYVFDRASFYASPGGRQR